jgi:hypothetical protein
VDGVTVAHAAMRLLLRLLPIRPLTDLTVDET